MKNKSIKLLSKTIRTYLYVSIPIFFMCTIGFYYFLKYVITDMVDESLKEDQALIFEFVNNDRDDVSELHKRISSGYSLNKIDKDSIINDRFYFVNYLDSTANEVEVFRELQTSILIKDNEYELVIHQSFVESDSLIYSIITFSVFLFIMLTLGITLLHWYSSGKIWSPFYKTLSQIHAFDITNHKEINFDKVNIKEFNVLNKNLKNLTDRIKSEFEKQKKFIDNVAHELQTPLAVLSSHIEVLIQESELDLNQANIINNLDATVMHLKKLNNSLLLLSRIDNDQFSKSQKVSLVNIIEKYLDNHKEEIKMQDIAINRKFVSNSSLMINPTLADVLLGNLLSNSIEHNEKGGLIEIELDDKILTISNTGKELNINPEKLFDKYVRFGDSKKSTGIGLSIVKEICNYYDIDIRYTIRGFIHVLKLTFPKQITL